MTSRSRPDPDNHWTISSAPEDAMFCLDTHFTELTIHQKTSLSFLYPKSKVFSVIEAYDQRHTSKHYISHSP